MKPEKKFLDLPRFFWAYVRTISEKVGYTERRQTTTKGKVKVPELAEISKTFSDLSLDSSQILTTENIATNFGQLLMDYFHFRALVLNSFVEPRLMDVKRAKNEFEKLYKPLSTKAPIPMNKQKGDKKVPAYFTGIINMLIEENIEGFPCDYNPQKLTKITTKNLPLRTMARRVDGAFPSVLNPIALWEIKEYYFTTSFGSRVADGVYETLLDGMELFELWENEGIKVHHYMMVDAHDTWWFKGKSYL